MYVYSPCDPSSLAIPFCCLTSMYIFTLEKHTLPAVLYLSSSVFYFSPNYICRFVCNCLFALCSPPLRVSCTCLLVCIHFLVSKPSASLCGWIHSLVLTSLCVSCYYHKTRKRNNSPHTAGYTLKSGPDFPDLYPPPHAPASLINICSTLILQQGKDLEV